MLITTHVWTGALVGRVVGSPVAAALAGAVSHLVLDQLPHWGRPGGEAGVMTPEDYRVAVRDGLTGLALLSALVAASRGHRLPVAAGIFGACLPDMDKPGQRFFGRSPWPQRFDDYHVRIQLRVESPDRLAQDTAVAAAGAFASLLLLRRTASR